MILGGSRDKIIPIRKVENKIETNFKAKKYEIKKYSITIKGLIKTDKKKQINSIYRVFVLKLNQRIKEYNLKKHANLRKDPHRQDHHS